MNFIKSVEAVHLILLCYLGDATKCAVSADLICLLAKGSDMHITKCDFYFVSGAPKLTLCIVIINDGFSGGRCGPE